MFPKRVCRYFFQYKDHPDQYVIMFDAIDERNRPPRRIFTGKLDKMTEAPVMSYGGPKAGPYDHFSTQFGEFITPGDGRQAILINWQNEVEELVEQDKDNLPPMVLVERDDTERQLSVQFIDMYQQDIIRLQQEGNQPGDIYNRQRCIDRLTTSLPFQDDPL